MIEYKKNSETTIYKKDNILLIINPHKGICISSDTSIYELLALTTINDNDIDEFCSNHDFTKFEVLQFLIDNYIILSDFLENFDNKFYSLASNDIKIFINLKNIKPDQFDNILEEISNLYNKYKSYAFHINLKGLENFENAFQYNVLKNFQSFSSNIDVYVNFRNYKYINLKETKKFINSFTINLDEQDIYILKNYKIHNNEIFSDFFDYYVNTSVIFNISSILNISDEDIFIYEEILHNNIPILINNGIEICKLDSINLYKTCKKLVSLIEKMKADINIYKNIKEFPLKTPDFECPNNKHYFLSDSRNYYILKNNKVDCSSCKLKKEQCLNCELSYICQMKCCIDSDKKNICEFYNIILKYFK